LNTVPHRRRPYGGARSLAFVLLTLAGGCTEQAVESADVAAEVHVTPRSRSAFEPIVVPTDLDARKVALGDRLFHDSRLSADDSVACASCHSLDTGGVDRRPTSVGIGGAVGPINAPTVFNSGYFFRQFWDGRAASLEEQANGPVHAAAEMGSNWEQAIAKLSRDRDFVRDFTAVYPSGLSGENFCDAIATFERSLVTPNSDFDRFLGGDEAALGPEAARGYRMFRNYGCVSCHQGVAMGGNMYQLFGVMGDYFADRGSPSDADNGRFNVTHDERDRHVFKVPTLRNIAATAPYFHDGSAETLDAAVRVMSFYQLGRDLDEEEVAALVAFLESLTGEYNGRSLR
jgi:cytochrome c peroxidase